MTRRWIITALGQDRPAIVAGVTKALYQLGANLEDSAMTRLEGEFAVMLIFSIPPHVTPQTLQRAFSPLERRLQLSVHVKPLTKSETDAPTRRGQRYLISVYGADRPGIVYRVSEALAGQRVNIIDVHTHRSAPTSRRERGSLYLLLLEVELPARVTPAVVERRLKALSKTLKVEVSIRPDEADVL